MWTKDEDEGDQSDWIIKIAGCGILVGAFLVFVAIGFVVFAGHGYKPTANSSSGPQSVSDERSKDYNAFLFKQRSKEEKNHPRYCLLVRTKEEQKLALFSLLTGVEANHYDNISVYLLNTGEDWAEMSELVDLTHQLLDSYFIRILPINQQTVKTRFPELVQDQQNLAITDLAIQYLAEQTVCDYITIADGNHWYSASLVSAVRPLMTKNVDIIGFEYVSPSEFPDGSPYVYRAGKDSLVKVEFKPSWIELPAIAFRLNFLIQENIPFIIDQLEDDPKGTSIQYANHFGEWISRVQKLHPTVEIVRRALASTQ
jgi:hypothetical protein